MSSNEIENASGMRSKGRSVQLPPPRIAAARTVNSRQDFESSPAAGQDDAVVLSRSLLASTERLSSQPRDIVSLAQAAVHLVTGLKFVQAAAYFVCGGTGELRVAARSESGYVFDRDAFLKELTRVCQAVSQTRARQTFEMPDVRNLITCCMPVIAGGQLCAVLAVSLTAAQEQFQRADQTDLELIVNALRLWHSERNATECDAELRGLAALIELAGKLQRAKLVVQAGHLVVNELREYVGCQRVALGISRRHWVGCRLTTLSEFSKLDPCSDTAKLFQAACDETAVRESLAVWPPLNPNAEHTSIALRRLVEQQNVEAAVGLPLFDNRVLVGALILCGSRSSLLEARTLNLLKLAIPILASSLHQSMRLEQTWLARTWRRLLASSWTSRTATVVVVIGIVFLLSLPWPYRIKVACRLEPMTRRIVSAPYDGFLDQTLAVPGEFVREGQILARMDAREIRWELSTITSERSQALKEFDTELAHDNIARAQLARMEAERLRRKLDLLEYRERNHELRSPLEGVILNGSLENLAGSPVRTGQPLFDVAELHPLRLEMAVPAEDYFHIRPGQSVTVTFDSFAEQEFEGTILRIRPRSELREQKNVFVAEMEVANPDGRLRPGIEGRAVITGDRHSLAWNTFHKAWEALWRTDLAAIVAKSELSVPLPAQIAALKSSRGTLSKASGETVTAEHDTASKTTHRASPSSTVHRVAGAPEQEARIE